MNIFRAPQSSVVHMKGVLRSNQPLVWPGEIFQRFIDTVVYKCCLSFRQQWTSCAKYSLKTGSLLGYLDGMLSNHTVGCCNKKFSFLCQLRREKLCFPSMDSIFLLYYLRDCNWFDATFGQLFTLQPPIFLFNSDSLCSHLVEKRIFSNVHG